MGRYLGPRKKYMRRFGLIEDERAGAKPRKRKTDYGLRLEEKQKAKFIYGVSEKQFKKYVDQALRSKNPNEELLILLETRLDNTVFRLGFAPTIPAARQLVSHGHVKINDRKVDIPSYHVHGGETLKLATIIADNPKLKEAWAKFRVAELPSWLWKQGSVGKILHLPGTQDMRQDINSAYIFELYAK